MDMVMVVVRNGVTCGHCVFYGVESNFGVVKFL